MAKADTSSKGEELFIKGNGETTKCKEKERPISKKVNQNTQASGKLTNTMDGVFCIPTLIPTLNGFHMKASSKMESSKEEAKCDLKMDFYTMASLEAIKSTEKVKS